MPDSQEMFNRIFIPYMNFKYLIIIIISILSLLALLHKKENKS